MFEHYHPFKSKISLVALCLLIGAFSSAHAQSISCSAFSITNAFPDTTNPGDYQFSIQFIGNPNDFANAPYVSVVRDCNGDTIATGTLFYFGQLGATTQDYPVTLTGNGSVTCYPLTASFIINFADTCQLVFNPTGIHESPTNAQNISIYPNPTANHIQVACLSPMNSLPFRIYDIAGKMVKAGVLRHEEPIAIDEFTNGIYFLKLEDGTNHLFQVIKD